MPTESRDPVYQAVRAAVLALPGAPADLAEYKMEVVPAGWAIFPVEAHGGGVPITRAPSATIPIPTADGIGEMVVKSPHRRLTPHVAGVAADGTAFRVGWNAALRTVAVWIP